MKALPDNLVEYKRSRSFTTETVPSALTSRHDTKPGVWVELVVERGTVTLHRDGADPAAMTEGATSLVAPELPHHVELAPDSVFHLRFLRRA